MGGRRARPGSVYVRVHLPMGPATLRCPSRDASPAGRRQRHPRVAWCLLPRCPRPPLAPVEPGKVPWQEVERGALAAGVVPVCVGGRGWESPARVPMACTVGSAQRIIHASASAQRQISAVYQLARPLPPPPAAGAPSRGPPAACAVIAAPPARPRPHLVLPSTLPPPQVAWKLSKALPPEVFLHVGHQLHVHPDALPGVQEDLAPLHGA